jgi:hypothetical protein
MTFTLQRMRELPASYAWTCHSRADYIVADK